MLIRTRCIPCLINVVSGKIDQLEAILIRVIEPYVGIQWMNKRRPVSDKRNLTSGPGKLTKAMGITMSDYRHPLFLPPLFIASGRKPEEIVTSPRIGIGGSGEAQHYPWRFSIKGNQYVSRR